MYRKPKASGPCKVKGCPRQEYCRGKCITHYRRGQRGRPDRCQSVQSAGNDALAQLSYAAIRAVVLYKHGWEMSRTRVEQICYAAEQKLKRRLAALVEGEQ